MSRQLLSQNRLWIAWKRDLSTIVGCGNSFDEAKKAAISCGERSIFLMKSGTMLNRRRHPYRTEYMVAVFISRRTDVESEAGRL